MASHPAEGGGIGSGPVFSSVFSSVPRPVIAVTCGEPAGIGPEISLRCCWQLRSEICSVLIGDARQLAQLAAQIDPAIRLNVVTSIDFLADGMTRSRILMAQDLSSGGLLVVDVRCPAAIVPGTLDPANGLAVLRTLDIAIEAALNRKVDAITTAPLQKSTINDAGVPFSGHTEYLAEKTATAQVVMMLATQRTSPPLRVALATTHLPLKDVSAALTIPSLLATLQIIDHDLKTRFGIARPCILVTGLNPHAGENGYLGHEEIDTIQPALRQAQALHIDARGPYPADTLFQPRYLKEADCVLAMFHDQGLPVLKYAGFGAGINITLGLPVIRTSVDHGTALDLAARGTGQADSGSMLEALRAAAVMAQ